MNQEQPRHPICAYREPEEGRILDDVVQNFVELWGEMGSSWGINRTMAQIHALLYCTDEPIDTDTIMERLSISRGNANMNLRSLVDWNLVRKVQREGSRKDYYFAEKDVWFIMAQIVKERQRQEILPVQKRLHAYIGELQEADDSEQAKVLRERFVELISLMEVLERFSDAILPILQETDTQKMSTFLTLIEYIKSDQEV